MVDKAFWICYSLFIESGGDFIKRSNTEVGKYLKKLRVEESETLSDMAEKLDVSASFLSAVEVGKRSIPNNMVDKIQQTYELSEIQRQEFFEARSVTNNKVELTLDKKNENTARNEVALSFGWKFLELTEEQISKIKEILEEGGGNER